jgi:hypothetical protein
MKVVVNPKNNLSVLVNQSRQVRRIADLIDVDLMGLEDGSLLIYNATSEKFEASILLEKQNINGGHF